MDDNKSDKNTVNDKQHITIAELIAPWLTSIPSQVGLLPCQELSLDSRQMKSGSVFIAVPGETVDGRQFIHSAIESGALAVLAQASEEKQHGVIEYYQQSAIIYIDKLQSHVSHLAMRFYPLKNNKLIAVTGTNGKTTITQLLAQWLQLLGHKAGVMGTTGNGFLHALMEAKNTTGSPIEVTQCLYDLEKQGANYTALEVSSHGLVQGRVAALPFEVGIFSNLSRDHLDYHNTMQEYAQAKRSLFTTHQCYQKIINADDEVGRQWLNEMPQAIAVSVNQQPQTKNAIWAESLTFSQQGITLKLAGIAGEGILQAPLIGEFNASNLLLCFASLYSLGFSASELLQTASKLAPVIGRMELFSVPNKPKVVVDYAHTPDALEKALRALQIHCDGELWVMCGCGGERDKGKRPMIAAIAEREAGHVILSDDNPRSEDPQAIIKDMLAGMNKPERAIVLHDRKRALSHALHHASPQDIILVAGKGHEDYQIYAEQIVSSSDRENTMQLLEGEL